MAHLFGFRCGTKAIRIETDYLGKNENRTWPEVLNRWAEFSPRLAEKTIACFRPTSWLPAVQKTWLVISLISFT
jgi:hypothetical protein